MLELCLFDLDNTLVKTDDLKDLREACKNNANPTRLAALGGLIRLDPNRRIYSLAFLQSIRAQFTNLKLGVFTRAPQSYTAAVLAWAYPGFVWDVVVAFEDVSPTKPYGNGVWVAMQRVGLQQTERVALIGDNDIDVKSAYNAGCLAAIDKQAWPWQHTKEQWRALDLVPDAVLDGPNDVLEFLDDHRPFLPNFERLLESGAASQGLRYVKIGYFVDRQVEDDGRRYPISVAGRSFSNYPSVQRRRQGHSLSDSIEVNKGSLIFPPAWIEVIRNFVELTAQTSFGAQDMVLCVVPHRPERLPRLESLLRMVETSLATTPIGATVTCAPDLLGYRAGVRSNHGEHLGATERFANVRDHLFVQRRDLVNDERCYIVIDDVVTTGASLIYAQKRLEAAGAGNVKLLGLGKNIGDLYAYP